MNRIRSSRIVRGVSLVLTGLLMGTLMLTPVGAHVSDSVDHLWSTHIKPEVRAQHFTKNQTEKKFFTRKAANNRFLPGGDLPKGATVRGVWGIADQASGINHVFFDDITFGWTLATKPHVHIILPHDAVPTGCTGDAEFPGAKPGHLCIFVRSAVNATLDSCGVGGLCSSLSYRYGALLVLESLGEGVVTGDGTWAVSA